MGMIIQTRGDLPPAGKQKVYVTGLGKDIRSHGKAVADRLLKLYNCAVLYNDFRDGTAISPEFPEDISLLVYLVTNEFLTGDNAVRSTELPFAAKNGIPMLPLLLEPGISTLFYRTIGSTQYLNWDDHDDTADRIQDKLRKFLNGVLVSTEAEEQIRKNFSSRIFLSYRKKDRAYARRLMKTIHACEALQDVCIWYDEYLVPGENYTDALEKQLSEADLVILMVTPSILEEKNYVLEHEYPSMVRLGKKRIAIEMAATPEDALLKYYRFDEFTDGNDDAAVVRAVCEALQQFSPNNAPSHLSLTGAAYLTGIEMEKNYELGKKLLIQAAEVNHPLAMELLVPLYRNGLCGEEPNLRRAVEWEKLLIRQVEKGYTSTEFTEGKEIYFRLWDLGDDYMLLGENRLAFQTFQAMGDKALEDFERDGTFDARRCYATALEKLGDLYSANGEHKQAMSLFMNALREREGQAGQTNAPEELRRVGAGYVKMAQVLLALRDKKAAMGYAVKAVIRFEDLYKEENSVTTRRDMAAAYVCMADIHAAGGNKKECTKILNTALQAFLLNLREDESPEALRDLALCLRKRSDSQISLSLFNRSKREEWMRDLKDSADLYKTLYARTKLPADGFAYAVTLYDYASLVSDRDGLIRAGQVAEVLCKANPNNAEYKKLCNQCRRAI